MELYLPDQEVMLKSVKYQVDIDLDKNFINTHYYNVYFKGDSDEQVEKIFHRQSDEVDVYMDVYGTVEHDDVNESAASYRFRYNVETEELLYHNASAGWYTPVERILKNKKAITEEVKVKIKQLVEKSVEDYTHESYLANEKYEDDNSVALVGWRCKNAGPHCWNVNLNYYQSDFSKFTAGFSIIVRDAVTPEELGEGKSIVRRFVMVGEELHGNSIHIDSIYKEDDQNESVKHIFFRNTKMREDDDIIEEVKRYVHCALIDKFRGLSGEKAKR